MDASVRSLPAGGPFAVAAEPGPLPKRTTTIPHRWQGSSANNIEEARCGRRGVDRAAACTLLLNMRLYAVVKHW